MAFSEKRSLIVLVALAAVVLLTGLGNRCLQRERETRIALTAREMADGGSWLVPEYRGELRLKKPPVPYWLVAGLYKLGAPVNSPFWARLPSALFALGLVLVTYFFGAVMVGRRAAYFGALAMLLMQPFLVQGRVAEADAAMMFFLVTSIGCAYLAMAPRGGGRWWLAAGACAGMAFMMKGVAGVVIPLGTIAMFAALRRDQLRGGRWRWALGGLFVCALIAVPWYFYIYLITHGDGAASEAVAKQMEETFGKDGRHPEPFWYYLTNWPGTMALWGWLAPFAAWALWKKRHRRGTAFLFCWFVVGLVLLSLITTKQRHYALILVPATALAAGWWLSRLRVRRGFPSIRTMEITSAVLALGAAIWLGWWQPRNDDEAVIPGFMAEAQGLTADSAQIWTSGSIPWCTEFYFDRPVESMRSTPKAWRARAQGRSADRDPARQAAGGNRGGRWRTAARPQPRRRPLPAVPEGTRKTGRTIAAAVLCWEPPLIRT